MSYLEPPRPWWKVDDAERLARHDRERPETAPHRFATEEEVKGLLAELDQKWFGAPKEPYQVSWARDRLKGAPGG